MIIPEILYLFANNLLYGMIGMLKTTENSG